MKHLSMAWIALAAFVAATLGGSCGASAQQSSAPGQSRATVNTALRNELPALERNAQTTKSMDTRDLSNGALVALLTTGNGSMAERLLDRQFAAQDMNEGDPEYGQFKWRTGDPKVTTKNAIDFGALALGPIFLNFGDRLSSQFKASARPHLQAAIAALRNHHVRVTYTNIYLMNVVSMMLIGQALHDGSAISEAEQRMNAWMALTQRNGITEFESPTYYTADIDALVQGYRYAANPSDKAKFKSALDYIWTDIAANYLPAASKMSAPYSRDYDFLRGVGSLTAWLHDEGWTTERPSKGHVLFERAALLDDFRPGGYHPSASIKALAFSGPRNVTSRRNDKSNGGRFAWIGRNIALGCGSGHYSPQDKMFAATFAGFETPQMNVALDVYNNPYGTQRRNQGPGHHKPVHLAYNPACVERNGNALLTADVNTMKIPQDAQTLSLNVLLPKSAQIAVNGSPVSLNSPTTIPVGLNSVVTASTGGGIAGVRIVQADPVDGMQPRIDLVADQAGLQAGVVRLRITLLPNGGRGNTRNEHVAILASVADGMPASQMANRLRSANVSSNDQGREWVASANIDGESLAVSRPANTAKRITGVAIDGQPVRPGPLSVNGRPIASLAWNGRP